MCGKRSDVFCRYFLQSRYAYSYSVLFRKIDNAVPSALMKYSDVQAKSGGMKNVKASQGAISSECKRNRVKWQKHAKEHGASHRETY